MMKFILHTQGRLLHWSMDAACVLEKTRGERKSCIFSWKLGGRKIKGGRKTKLLKHILHCFLLFSQKFSRSLRSLDYFLFSSSNQGMRTAGAVKSVSLLKVEWKNVRFSVLRFWWPNVDHTKSKLNTELYTFSCTGRQSCREQDN